MQRVLDNRLVLGLEGQLELRKNFQWRQFVLGVLEVQCSQVRQIFLVGQQGLSDQWGQHGQLGYNLELQLCLGVPLDQRAQQGRLGQGIQERRACLQVQLGLGRQGNQGFQQGREHLVCLVFLARLVVQLKGEDMHL